MRMRLQPDGVWKLDSRTEGIKSYEQLPQKARDILNLAVVMAPYEMIPGERLGVEYRVNVAIAVMYPPNRKHRWPKIRFIQHKYLYQVQIETKLLKQWKVQEEKENENLPEP